MNNSVKLYAPLLRSADSELLRSLDFLIAAMPAVIWSVIAYGTRAAAVILMSMLSGVIFEVIYAIIFRKGARIPSAAVICMIIAMFMPAGVNYLLIPVTSFIAVTIRRFFGGIINPIAAALVPFYMFTGMMTNHTAIFTKLDVGVVSYWDRMSELSDETTLSHLMSGLIPEDSLLDIFLGNTTESIGALSSLLLILGGLYLLMRRTVSWHIPVGYLAGSVVVWFICFFDGAHYEYLLYHMFAGGIFLGAFFGVTEYSSSPVTTTGRFIHGAGCGALTMLFRKIGFAEESILLSMLVMSLFSRVIDMITAERYFGYKSKKLGERFETFLPNSKN